MKTTHAKEKAQVLNGNLCLIFIIEREHIPEAHIFDRYVLDGIILCEHTRLEAVNENPAINAHVKSIQDHCVNAEVNYTHN